MNILFFSDNFPPEKNAAASRVYERGCYWTEWGHRLTVLTCAPNFPDGKVYDGYRNVRSTEEMSGMRVIRLKTFIAANRGTVLRILDFLSYMWMAFWTALFQPRPDLIVATSPQFFAAVAACAVATIRRVPFVFELSDLWPASIVAVGAMKPNLGLRLLEKLELLMYRRAVAVVALTQAFKNDLVRRGIPEDKISVVINGADMRRFQPRPRDPGGAARWGIADGEFVIGYIGTLGMAHALETVLDAAGRLAGTNIRFLLVGSGAAREALVKEAACRKLTNVTFVPPQPKEAIPAVWSLCDVALVHLKDTPVFQTVIPSKIFEAMAMGLPVLLGAPEGEASRLVRQEDVGICIPAQDSERLAAAALEFRDDSRRRHELSQHARDRAPSHTRERQAECMIHVLADALQAEQLIVTAAGD